MGVYGKCNIGVETLHDSVIHGVAKLLALTLCQFNINDNH